MKIKKRGSKTMETEIKGAVVYGGWGLTGKLALGSFLR